MDQRHTLNGYNSCDGPKLVIAETQCPPKFKLTQLQLLEYMIYKTRPVCLGVWSDPAKGRPHVGRTLGFLTIGIKAVNPRRGVTKETSLLLGKTTTRRRSALHRKIGAGLQQAAASTPSATQTRFLLEAMATSWKEEERWENMWRILD